MRNGTRVVVGGLLVCCFAVALVSAETIAWWRFEEGAPGEVVATVHDWAPDGTSEGDLSGGDPSGDPVYASTDHSLDVNGLADRVALQMDGVDDYIPNIPFVTLTWESRFTIECIFNWAGAVETPAEGFRAVDMILQQSDGLGTGRSLLYIITNEDDETVIPSLASYLGGATTNIVDVEVPSNQWVYAGATYDDGGYTLWLDTDLSDGIQPDSNFAENFLDFEDNDAPVIIGRHKNLVDYFHGMISELRVTDSGYGPDWGPPEDHFQVAPAANVGDWMMF